MGFFGIGVNSKTEESRASGKANADAANEGAGSVNPTGTGNMFGTLLGNGISAMSQFLGLSGKGISDSANIGAGSVNPTGTGNAFGALLGSGVSAMSNTLWSSGNAIAQSADGGAGSVSPYGTGTNFSTIFSSGIGSVSLYETGQGRANDANDGIGSVSAWDAGYDLSLIHIFFSSRESYGREVIENLSNCGFYEGFSDWLEECDKARMYPDIGDQREVMRMRAATTPYVFDTSESTAKYQIQVTIKYYQKA